MSEPRPARLAFLTDPEPGVFIFNVQTEDGELQRYLISRDKVLLLNKQTADILVKAFK